MSGDENDENGVDELTEHRWRSHAITSLYVFIYLFHGINFEGVIDVSCDFVFQLLHNTRLQNQKVFCSSGCGKSIIFTEALLRWSLLHLKKAALPLFAVDRKKQRRYSTAPLCPPAGVLFVFILQRVS